MEKRLWERKGNSRRKKENKSITFSSCSVSIFHQFDSRKPAQADEDDSAGKVDTLSSPKLDDKRIESLWASFKETAPAPAIKSDTAAKSSESSALSVPSKAPAPVPSEKK